MFKTPFKNIYNIVCPCPNAPVKPRLSEIVIDDGKLHEIIIVKRLVF